MRLLSKDGATPKHKQPHPILSPLSYTKTGFLAYVGISRQGFAETYSAHLNNDSGAQAARE